MPLSLTLLLIAMGLGVLPWPGPPLDFAEASESPERECCDPVYPLLTPTASTAVNPTGLLPTVPGPPSKFYPPSFFPVQAGFILFICLFQVPM